MSFARNSSIDVTIVKAVPSGASASNNDYLYAWEAHPHDRVVDDNLYLFYTKTLDLTSSTPIYNASGTSLGTISDIRSSNFPIEEVRTLNEAKIILRYSNSG